MMAFNHKNKRNTFHVDISNRHSHTQSLQALELTSVFTIHLERLRLVFSREKCGYKTAKIGESSDRSLCSSSTALESVL